MEFFFKGLGVVGIIFICVGILTRKRKTRDVWNILGGVCLAVYSIYLQDVIFIILQLIFTLTAVYDFSKASKTKK